MGASRNSAPVQGVKLWTPANVVTMVRICLVPVFVVALISPWPEWFGVADIVNIDKAVIAAGIFIVISCTDWLDGYLARHRNEVTTFGKFMDPLADKILVTAALLALVELGTLPSWVVLVIIAREFIVSGVRMVAASEGVVIAASYYGKFKTVFQMIAIVMFTVKDSHMVGSAGEAFGDGLWVASWAVMIVALLLTVVSMLDYVAKARFLLGFGGDGAKEGGQPEVALGELAGEEDIERLAAEVVGLARDKRVTIGTAESLTGGMIAAALTGVPGSSEVFLGSVVGYATSVKERVLGVPGQVLGECGAVSSETAKAMATGACDELGCALSVAVTGIAGPGGAEPGKPVGTVWMGVASDDSAESELFAFEGDRAAVRRQTVAAALGKLRDELARR